MNDVIDIEEKTTTVMPMIYDRIAKIIEDMPAIGKDRDNKMQGFKYRGIDEVANVTHALLAKHRVFFTPHIQKTDRQILDRLKDGVIVGKSVLVCIEVVYKIYCADDQSYITVGPILGEAVDTGDKACNKAMSMALKYMLSQLFCIAFAEYDTDSDNPDANNGNGTPKSKELLNPQPETLPVVAGTCEVHMKKCYKLYEDNMSKEEFKRRVWSKLGHWPTCEVDDETIAKGL